MGLGIHWETGEAHWWVSEWVTEVWPWGLGLVPYPFISGRHCFPALLPGYHELSSFVPTQPSIIFLLLNQSTVDRILLKRKQIKLLLLQIKGAGYCVHNWKVTNTQSESPSTAQQLRTKSDKDLFDSNYVSASYKLPLEMLSNENSVTLIITSKNLFDP